MQQEGQRERRRRETERTRRVACEGTEERERHDRVRDRCYELARELRPLQPGTEEPEHPVVQVRNAQAMEVLKIQTRPETARDSSQSIVQLERAVDRRTV